MSNRAGLGIVLLAGGALWLLAATDFVDLSYPVAIGILLILIGVVIAVTPGRHGVLVLLGILIALAGVPALFVDSGHEASHEAECRRRLCVAQSTLGPPSRRSTDFAIEFPVMRPHRRDPA